MTVDLTRPCSFLLLGGGMMHSELARALSDLGVTVHIADVDTHCAASRYAWRVHQCDVRNDQELAALIDRIRPDGITCERTGWALSALSMLSDAHPEIFPSASAIALTNSRDKLLSYASSELSLPVVTDFLEGPAASDTLFTVTAIRGHYRRIDGKTSAVEMVDALWQCEPIGLAMHTYSFDGEQKELMEQSWQPLALPEGLWASARSIVGRIISALGGYGAYGVNLVVRGEDVYLSDVLPHPHPGTIVTRVTQRFSASALHARAMLGLPIDVTLTSPGAASILYGSSLDDSPITIQGLSSALWHAESHVIVFGKKRSYPGRRMAAALVTAEDAEIARMRARWVLGELEVTAYTPGSE